MDIKNPTVKVFSKTTVLDPELESGEQSYTEYYHHGNVYEPSILDGEIIPDPSTITEFLYFGKRKEIARFNHLNQLEEETFFDYGHTKAFENGYARKRMSRDNLVHF